MPSQDKCEGFFVRRWDLRLSTWFEETAVVFAADARYFDKPDSSQELRPFKDSGVINVKTHTFTAIVQKEDDGWIALCPELDVASQGSSIEEAKANLREAVELFLEVASRSELDQRLRSETYLSQLEVTIG